MAAGANLDWLYHTSSGAGFGGGWKMDGDLKRLATADAADPAWRVIVKGDGIEALKILEATNYWKGQFEPDSRSVLKN